MGVEILGAMLGGFAIYLGFTNRAELFVRYLVKQPPGYKQVDLPRFMLAMFIVIIPAYLLEESKSKFAWQYVTLILISMVVYWWPQLVQTTNDIGFSGVIK